MTLRRYTQYVGAFSNDDFTSDFDVSTYGYEDLGHTPRRGTRINAYKQFKSVQDMREN